MTDKEKKLTELKDRYEISNKLLESSHFNISHYDNKAGPLLSVTSINTGILFIMATILFTDFDNLSLLVRLFIFLVIIVNIIPISYSLIHLKKAITPHLDKTEKPTIRYFMDIVNNWSEESYVNLLQGKELPTDDKSNLPDFLESLIDSNARSIYIQSQILHKKTFHFKKAYNAVILSTIFLLILLFGIFFIIHFIESIEDFIQIKS